MLLITGSPKETSVSTVAVMGVVREAGHLKHEKMKRNWRYLFKDKNENDKRFSFQSFPFFPEFS